MLPGARFGRAGESVAQLPRCRRAVRPLTLGDHSHPELTGRRVLVVEDSPVVGPFAAEMLAELGCTVIGPAPNMAVARELVEDETLDAALLDINIRGEKVFALCDILQRKGVPFVITSGYADWQLPDQLEHCPQLPKPYTFDQMRDALTALLNGKPA